MCALQEKHEMLWTVDHIVNGYRVRRQDYRMAVTCKLTLRMGSTLPQVATSSHSEDPPETSVVRGHNHFVRKSARHGTCSRRSLALLAHWVGPSIVGS